MKTVIIRESDNNVSPLVNSESIQYYYAIQSCRNQLMNFLQPKYSPLDEDDSDDDLPDDDWIE